VVQEREDALEAGRVARVGRAHLGEAQPPPDVLAVLVDYEIARVLVRLLNRRLRSGCAGTGGCCKDTCWWRALRCSDLPRYMVMHHAHCLVCIQALLQHGYNRKIADCPLLREHVAWQ
jgi:hypothetical protein